MNKICTDLEQSKKLIELGIDINTADMHYNNLSVTHGSDYVNDFNAELMDYNSAVKLLAKYTHNPLFEIIPAWSLTALLDILTEQDFTIKVIENEFNIDIPIRHCKIWFPSLFDAAFEMVIWLKKNNKI